MGLESLRGTPDEALGDLLTGKPVVVNFFASWCGPCVDEMPAIEAVHQALGDQVTIVGLANQDGTDDALGHGRGHRGHLPDLRRPRPATRSTYFGGIAMPTTVFIAPDGTVVDVNRGELDEAALRAKLTQHFGIAA